MSRLFIFLAGVVLAPIPVDFISTLRIARDGEWYTTTDVSVSNNTRAVSFQVATHSNDFVMIGASNFDDHPTGTAEISFKMTTDNSQIYTLSVENTVFPYATRISYLPIGFDSPLTRDTGSVAVIRRDNTHSELVIRSTADYFRDNCRPDTLMTLSVESPRNEIGVQVNLWNGTNLLTNYGNHQLFFGRRSIFNRMLRIPREMYERIREIMISSGGFVPTTHPNVFSECSRASIEQLPTIDLRYDTGSIVFQPADYIDFNAAADDSCRLRVDTAESGRTPEIDPLMLIGKNFRVTSENVWDICDSTATL
jgi:hypothetical protein